MADLIKRKVTVIMAGGPPAALAAKAATSTIPVVFTTGDNPVQTGLVTSLGRPRGNVTGVHVLFTELESKKLGLLRDVVPKADVVAALVNQNSSGRHWPDGGTAGSRAKIRSTDSNYQCRNRAGPGTGLCVHGAVESRCAARGSRSLFQRRSGSDCVACGASCDSRNL